MTDATRPAGLMTATEKQRSDVAAVHGMLGGARVSQAHEGLPEDASDPEAEAALDGEQGDVVEDAPPEHVAIPTSRVGVPDWFVMPDGVELEPGTSVAFVRIDARQTAKPKLGDRQCLLALLSVKEEELAYRRAAAKGGSDVLAVGELALQMIKVIDGRKPDWVRPGQRTSPQQFWNDIGPKYRGIIRAWFVKTHVMTKEDRASFLSSSLDDRIVGG